MNGEKRPSTDPGRTPGTRAHPRLVDASAATFANDGLEGEATPPSLSDADVGKVAVRIAELDRQLGWDRTLAIGDIVIRSFFGGNVEAWHNRRDSQRSLRRLAEHPNCPLKKSALADAVGVYVAAVADPELPKATGLAPSHVACVLKLEHAARRHLLRQVQEQGLSVRELAERVRAIRYAGGKRVPQSVARKPLAKVQQVLTLLREARLSIDDLELAPNEQFNISRTISDIRDELELFDTTGRRELSCGPRNLV